MKPYTAARLKQDMARLLDDIDMEPMAVFTVPVYEAIQAFLRREKGISNAD